MRHLGIDYGTKRVGLALSDEGGSMAFPYAVLPNTPELAAHIEMLVTDEDVGAVVIGTSHDLDGTPNPLERDITDFIIKLREHTAVSVARESEVFTSQEALRVQGKNEMTDASAAAIILNSYLTKQKNA
jgi:putative Holliday junction resolvase